jgi:hypothetical protein
LGSSDASCFVHIFRFHKVSFGFAAEPHGSALGVAGDFTVSSCGRIRAATAALGRSKTRPVRATSRGPSGSGWCCVQSTRSQARLQTA